MGPDGVDPGRPKATYWGLALAAVIGGMFANVVHSVNDGAWLAMVVSLVILVIAAFFLLMEVDL
jgi:uncharacterized YccA/Bax inhibitor family protein